MVSAYVRGQWKKSWYIISGVSHCVSALRTTQLLLSREMVTVYYELHTKHTCTMWEECRTFEC